MCEPVAFTETTAEVALMADTEGVETSNGALNSAVSFSVQAAAIIPMANSAINLEIYFIIQFL